MTTKNENCQIGNLEKKRANPRDPLRIQQRALEQGRGLGMAGSYEPFIQIERHGFSSQGRSHAWPDPLNTSIIGHVLSDLERSVLIHASAIEGSFVRTQYPMWRVGVEPEFAEHVGGGESLDLGTIRIANDLGFRPPRMRGEDTVLTLDLLVKIPGAGTFAAYVKYQKELPAKGTRGEQLLLITREYWRRRNVELLVVTEAQAKDPATMRWLNWASSIRGSFAPGSEARLREIVQSLVEETDDCAPMVDRIACLGVPSEQIVHALKYAVWVGFVLIDFQRWDRPCLADPWTIELASTSKGLVSANCFSAFVAGRKS